MGCSDLTSEDSASEYSMVHNVSFYGAYGYDGPAVARMVAAESSYSQKNR